MAAILGRARVQGRIEVIDDAASLPQVITRALSEGTDTVVAGGGDGTVSAVASLLVGTAARLGVLPLGTLNHFAKDLGLPLDTETAMAVILGGHVTQVDVGEVNGRLFLNNSSIGLYPRMVRLRQRVEAHGLRKWLVAVRAMFAVMRHRSDLAVRLTTDDEAVMRRTPLVFIGNNVYRMAGLDPGTRPSLTDGVLSLYILHANGWGDLLRAAWHVVKGRVDEEDTMDVYRLPEVTIELRRPRVQVALDGEVVPLRTPLRYRVRRRALQVLVPAPPLRA